MKMSLKRTAFLSVILFSILSLLFVINHEMEMIARGNKPDFVQKSFRNVLEASRTFVARIQNISDITEFNIPFLSPYDNYEEQGALDYNKTNVSVLDDVVATLLEHQEEQKEAILTDKNPSNIPLLSSQKEPEISSKFPLKSASILDLDIELDDDDYDDISIDDLISIKNQTSTVLSSKPSVPKVASILDLEMDDDDNDDKNDNHDDKTTSNINFSSKDSASASVPPRSRRPTERGVRGSLTCNGRVMDSEVIYWRDCAEDRAYVSTLSPYHPAHPRYTRGEAEKMYLSFEYDQGGWNNMRMSMECIIILAHALGRIFVVPPVQHLYLLSQMFKTADNRLTDELGFQDFFNVSLLQRLKGLHVMTMKDFLQTEAITGHLHGKFPPGNDTNIWGRTLLWPYLDEVADATPEWGNSYLALPLHPYNFSYEDLSTYPSSVIERFNNWMEQRSGSIVHYDEHLQIARHIHIPGDGKHRLLMHHYSFVFFADLNMQKYYRRFVRDNIRYRDEIFCAGHELVQAIRDDSRRNNPENNGEYYALHIRRGDFQFKDVKLSAFEIWKNLHSPNGIAIIPNNSFVYISTDDPDGLCTGCLVNRIPCETYKTPKPVGCPEDTSWNAFREAGWTLRFLRDYLSRKDLTLKDLNPNYQGMVEVIACTRAKIFAGTVHSTFTGYILRIRGYMGLGDNSYYHSNRALYYLRDSPGTGWWREWRNGWTDDKGDPIS